MRVAFAGTPAFAGVALQRLLDAGLQVPLVLTQPDRPAGRGMRLHSSPVKDLAVQHGLAVAQPRSLRLDGKFPDDAAAAQAALRSAAPDVLVVAAYGLILPPWLLELPPRGCLNIHASLLPRWRGAAPIQRAIEAGDTCTGITIMQMDAGLDTGDMLLVEVEPIRSDDTTERLQERLAERGAQLIVQALQLLARGELSRTPQPASGIEYAAKIDKSEAPIDWSHDAAVIERRVRAFDPFPGVALQIGDETVKLWRAEVAHVGQSAGAPGEVIAVDVAGPVVACGRGALRLLELQRPGGRRASAASLQAQLRLSLHTRLGTAASPLRAPEAPTEGITGSRPG